ncbi:MAG: hypothetical protein IJX16_05765 [Clostridia bacterium]|nr:hypothetical protein [Clostridia bacterium]
MKKKTILSAIVSIMLCLSLISGATLALFTSESKVNIAVTSGKVEVVAYADENSLKTWSDGDEMANGMFEVGGSAEIVGGNVKLNKMVPEDKVAFTIVVENNSNVNIQYRLHYEATGELMPALTVSATLGGEATSLLVDGKTKWAFVEANKPIAPIEVTIYFPSQDDPLTEVNEDNNYQNKTADINFIVEAVQGNAELPDEWDGSSASIDWFTKNPNAEVFELGTAADFAGLALLLDNKTQTLNIDDEINVNLPVTFEGQTIKLKSDIDLGAVDKDGNPIPFDPICSYRNNQAFKGTFDGQGHTIFNMSQNTWELDTGYYYSDLGLGLFGLVEGATVKNLTIDGANISGESAICGTVAACSYGDSTFENITVSNSKGADYQYYAGGIVGWASGNQKFINCDVDDSTTIAAQWGDFDNSTGGVIGGCGGSATIYLKDCDVACRIDAYNDVTSSYQWYAYRRCGMLIGNTGKTTDIDGTTYAYATQLTCENVTVTYGDWANYTYCEFAGTSWPYVRVQAGVSNSAYSNPRYGHPTDANGNKVVDDNHVHNDGEDHFIECTFDQLYGGGQGVYGAATHDGVTVTYNNK